MIKLQEARSIAVAGSAAIRGVIVPAGVSSVYDQALGKNLKTTISYTFVTELLKLTTEK
jgi:hypothetical protein